MILYTLNTYLKTSKMCTLKILYYCVVKQFIIVEIFVYEDIASFLFLRKLSSFLTNCPPIG